MPRKGSDPIGVRQFVVAPKDTTFLDFDFSQIELRVGAFYCRDPRMMETYRSGGDIHASTTSVIFGISVFHTNAISIIGGMVCKYGQLVGRV